MSKPHYIYGRHGVGELLRARPNDVRCLYVVGAGRTTWLSNLVSQATRQNVKIVDLSKRALADLLGDVPHQGIAAAVTPFAYGALEDLLQLGLPPGAGPLVALDQIQDPHNLGAIIRSTLALGGVGLLVPKDRSADITPSVVKAAAGATSALPVAKVTNLARTLELAKEAGYWIVGTVAEGGEAVTGVDFRRPTVLVIGSEGRGLRRLVGETCDSLAYIPMPGALGSLNASVAAGIVLYEALRQRSQ